MALQPKTKTFRELPSYYSWSDWDRIEAVKRAIRELEQGQLNMAAQVVDAMLRDDRIAGCLEQRCQALPSLPLSSEPRTRSGVEPTAVQRAIAQQVAMDWESFVPDAAATELQQWGVMLGVGFAQVIWTSWEKPVLEVWHPRHFFWRWDTRSFWVATDGDGMQEVIPGGGQWVVYAPHGLARAWMRGSIRSLYVPWLLRQWAMRDWGRWSEVYGSPFKKAKTPAAADEADKERFLREVQAMGSDTVVRIPQSPDPTQVYDVELVEATSTGSDGFDRLLTKCETAIAIRLLGQNLSTEVQSGALASTRVHDAIKDDLIEADSDRLGACLTEQLLRPWAVYNHGSAELAPAVRWVVKPPENKAETGNAMKAVGEGLSSLQRAGAKPDTDAILEKLAIPVTGPAEEPEPEEPKESKEKPDPGEKEKLSASLSRLNPSGADKGQEYVDALADKAREAGSIALRPDVMRVITAVLSANNYDELRANLISIYGEMQPDRMASVLQRAMVMAELAGMASVLEDL